MIFGIVCAMIKLQIIGPRNIGTVIMMILLTSLPGVLSYFKIRKIGLCTITLVIVNLYNTSLYLSRGTSIRRIVRIFTSSIR